MNIINKLIGVALALTLTATVAGAKLVREPQEKGTHRVMSCNIRITGLDADKDTPLLMVSPALRWILSLRVIISSERM